MWLLEFCSFHLQLPHNHLKLLTSVIAASNFHALQGHLCASSIFGICILCHVVASKEFRAAEGWDEIMSPHVRPLDCTQLVLHHFTGYVSVGLSVCLSLSPLFSAVFYSNIEQERSGHIGALRAANNDRHNLWAKWSLQRRLGNSCWRWTEEITIQFEGEVEG